MTTWPEWYSWEIELSIHVMDRMLDRSFSETDLRTMLDDATNVMRDKEPGRWAVTTVFNAERWEVILEPLERDRILRVITAYPIG